MSSAPAGMPATAADTSDLRFAAKLLDGREETTRRIRGEVAARLEESARLIESPADEQLEKAMREIGSGIGLLWGEFPEAADEAAKALNKLPSLFALRSTSREKTETRWLIGYEVGGPKWVSGFNEVRSRFGGVVHGTEFARIEPLTTDSVEEAIHFVRKRDAEALLTSTYHSAILRVEEHQWLDCAASSQGVPSTKGGPERFCKCGYSIGKCENCGGSFGHVSLLVHEDALRKQESASSSPSETAEEMIWRKAEAFDKVRTLFLADDVSVLNTFIVRDPESLSEEEQLRQAKLIAIQGSIATLLDWGSDGIQEAAMSRPTGEGR